MTALHCQSAVKCWDGDFCTATNRLTNGVDFHMHLARWQAGPPSSCVCLGEVRLCVCVCVCVGVCLGEVRLCVCVCVCVCRWATYRRATWQFDALWTRSLLTRSPRLCCTRSNCTLRTSSSHLSVSARPRLCVHVAVSTAPRTSSCSHRRTTRKQNRSHR